ncbi:hypothetical protein EXE48_04310 [Halorubrum sp. ASP1]|uniref:oligosaccharide flippase family protein n=1 Tax=Halorubrum sp. ASP1 TaxID=2518114 RepID=UPI0010F73C99|nr:polysaccharide biosynthesis C-terminal domain-containing protein [Halorubrum sp. ASP1]TKX62987.1 hypothetical protein EXE48_04310 [Halorubrum sp. ASP1]
MPDRDDVYTKLFEGGVIFTIATIFGQGFGFLENILLTRAFSVENYGRISLGLTLVALAGPVLHLGLGLGAKRYIGEYITEDKPDKAYGTAILAIFVALFVGTVMGSVLYFFSNIISTRIFNDPEFIPLLKIFAGLVSLVSTLSVLSKTFQGWEKFGLAVCTGKFGQAILRLSAVVVAVVVGLSPNTMIAGIVVGFALLVIGGVIILLRGLRARAEGVEIPVKKLLVFSLPLLLSGFSARILSSADYLLLGVFRSTSSIALYRPAFLLGFSVSILFQALNRSYYPLAVRIRTTDSQLREDQMLATFLFWSLVLTMPIVVWTVTFSEELLSSLFQPRYAQSSNALAVIAISMLGSVIVGPVGTILEVYERARIVLYTYIVASVLNIIVNILLIPKYGIFGAAVGTGISLVLLNVMQFFFARQNLSFNYDYSRIIISSAITLLLIFPVAVLPFPDWTAVAFSLPYFLITIGTIVFIIPIRETDRKLFEPIFGRLDTIRQFL